MSLNEFILEKIRLATSVLVNKKIFEQEKQQGLNKHIFGNA